MQRDDLVRLRHMQEAAQQAMDFLGGRRREELDEDPQLRFAVLHALQIVLEAASRVGPDGREELPDLAWADMAGMRNRLVHAYFDINLDTVWTTVRHDLPGLVQAIGVYLKGK